MRILLAHDLSAPAERAANLISRIHWPGSTVVRVVSSPIGIGPSVSSFATPHEARTHARGASQAIDLVQDRVATELRDAGLTVERGTLPGRPAPALAADAGWFDADLIVVGARPRGPVAAALLGSVSRTLVETSPCSVLVVRRPSVSRVLLVADGSSLGAIAANIVATWPLFEGAQIRVVGVDARHRSGAASGDVLRWAALRDARGATSRVNAVLDSAVEMLTGEGRNVESELRLGDTGTEIVAAARSWQADLVVMGAQAESLLHRVFFGSVVRKVLDDLDSSLLVARPRATREFGDQLRSALQVEPADRNRATDRPEVQRRPLGVRRSASGSAIW